MTTLVPLRPETFPAFAEQAIATDAEDSHKDEILDSAGGPSVGTVWFATPDNGSDATGCLFNIRIQPQFRGRGHAKAALDLLDTVARDRIEPLRRDDDAT
ncbi:MAG: GNAT family N-acetyltransferase [Rubrivivax sp.]